MKKNLFKLILPGMALFFGMNLVGCAIPLQIQSGRVGWSEYTTVPSKDYEVVGMVIVTLSGSSSTTEADISTDLMRAARDIGAHDIINVRVATKVLSYGKKELSASAIAIKYTTTLRTQAGESLLVKQNGGYVK
ncbi:hypothetical protein AGMMS49938_18800 [Fibrobacterales bacterium]|nr:hypothetical protein AGMMS49938_18800 [Fibrobacterales bacterium]